ncbi:MAG: LacI family transcriptional regulator [Candidatus Omnitrophica bacterium]|nr:LacI family transcriptional regulator [Candidatus Omnitrophota bacterium]
MTRIKKNPSQRVSIEDVAKLAGVSTATVSRVINKIGSVRGKNKAKVLDAIKQLKFEPSVFAQRLATGRSNVIALVIPRYEGVFYSFYALELIRGVGTLCAAFKLDLLLSLTDVRSSLNLRGVDGVIFADIIGNRHQVEDIISKNIPCVVINHYIDDLNVNCIAIDNAGGAQEAVNYLITLGHKKIAHITGDLVTQAASFRLEGYKRALRKNNIKIDPRYIFNTNYSRGQARLAADRLLRMSDPPTAVFVASDSMALEVMAVAKEMGKDVPRDISIVGFDDNPSGLYGPVALSTVRQPLIKMAEDSVKELHRLMTEKKETQVKKIILPTELVIRESCRPLGSTR